MTTGLDVAPRPASHARLGMALAVASAAGYGLNIVTAQIASTVGITGALMVFYRVFLMLACLAAAYALFRPSLAVARAERWPLLVFGLSSSVIGTAYMSTVAFLPVSVAVVIFYLFPILIVVAEPLVERTPLQPVRMAVALLAFIGVALVVGPRFDSLDPRGLALALLAAAGAALQFFAAARMPRTPIAAKLFWGHLLVLPGVTATLLWMDGFHSPAIFAAAPVAVAITLGAYVVSMALQLLALARIPAAVAGLTFCAEPLFASLFAALILGERLAGLQYLGAVIVLAAIAINAARSAGTGRA
jgi:drug/metabolite transporter (DMT)-like permease